MKYYTVTNWSKFQHYRDRNPPWIKLHYELLSSRDWVMLDDASRVLAVACMLIASRNEGHVPDDPAYLKRVAYLNKEPNLKPLLESGFLKLASRCKQMLADARPETETETEEETETKEHVFSEIDLSRDSKKTNTRQFKEFFSKTQAESEAFCAAWCNWIEFRKQKRNAIQVNTAKLQLKKLETFGPIEKQIAVIEQSIMHGWTGLFEVKSESTVNASNNTSFANQKPASFFKSKERIDYGF